MSNADNKLAARYQILSKAWRGKHEWALKHRQKLLAARAAGFYDKDPTRDYMLNLINRGVATIVPFLVEGNPKIMVETKIPGYSPYSFATQLALNFLLNKMKFDETVLIPAAVNSVFGMGIVRTYREYDRIISVDNEVIKSGTPRCVVIDDSNYIGDPSAKTRADFMVEGDMYRIPTAYAKDLFSKHADDVQSSGKLITKYGAEEIAQNNFDWNRMNLEDYSTFIDIYNYAEKTICTIMPEGNKAIILREIEYDGPGVSPYDVLGYNYHPESPIAIPPAWDWHPIDVSANLVAKTAREQAESQKNLILAEPASKKAAEKVLKGKNMDVILTKNIGGVQTISVGGVNADNYNWLAFAEEAFSKTGPNPDVLRGSGPAADTLGQEQMIFNNAARIVNNYYTRFHGFMTSIVEKLAWYVWTDPTVYVPFVEKIPGVGELQVEFSQADKVGDFYDFVFDVDPYSTQRTSPETNYQRLMQFSTQWVLPTLGQAMQQGARYDIPGATKKMAEYLGLDCFVQLYKTAVPNQLEQSMPFAMQPLKSGQTNDFFGATSGSKSAQSQRVQNEQGYGGESKPLKEINNAS